MKTNIINIGNSQGVILPATLLKKLQISNKSEVEIYEEDDTIVIRPRPRKGWEEQFETAKADLQEEKDVFEGMENEFDKQDWLW
jgi:antitoxin MazE